MDKHHPTIGLPRAMLYYRYRTLWQTFFRELEIPVVTSPLTDRSWAMWPPWSGSAITF